MIIQESVHQDRMTRYYIRNFDSWDEFDSLVAFVTQSLNGTITDSIDGPEGTRLRTIVVRGCRLVFVHDDMLGNCLFSPEDNEPQVLQDTVQLLQMASL